MQRDSLVFQKNLLIAIVVLFWFAQYVYVPFQTPYLIGMQVSSSMVGIIIGIYGFSQMALRMPIGIMADKNGHHKFFIIVGVASSALASIFRILLSPEIGFFYWQYFIWFSFRNVDILHGFIRKLFYERKSTKSNGTYNCGK